MKPHVKICGITRLEDADRALALGAEFIGLNFYPPSPRSIDLDRAVQLRRHVGDRARVVGVFVNHDAAAVAGIAARVGLDLLQFHGDEGPLELEPHAARAIKVFRVAGALPNDEVARFAQTWGLLFDSARGGGQASGPASFENYGGTGSSWSWDTVGSLPAGRRVFVAGGIRPDNVARLLARLSPWGIDVNSGVEAAPGRKDPELLERLFEEISHGQIASAS
ncbi:MAG TPA: phosphoribosylanthranilate isomerase [Thermoanaerobaculia bacterium]|jgi:phosphoribosylanthranilate isomerase|nr:phosphoribosylanthranilate isomerase [Thermoanaerobaculia bacterium]